MLKWLARFSFSFILLAIVFVWEGYQIQHGDRGPDQQGKLYAFYAAAFVCFGLGLRGVRERHRAMNEQDTLPRPDEDDLRR